MKKLNLCLLFLLGVLTASSQKIYFVYIQAETEQPFYVKMNERVYSSTSSGYVILPKLLDSTYNFKIGFSQSTSPEQNFSVLVNKRDRGFMLKNFGEKGWGLFDFQTLDVQMAITGNAVIEVMPKGDTTNVTAFTEILSKAADDPSLKEKPVQVIAEEKKTEDTVQVIPANTEAITEIKEPVVVKPDEIAEMPAKKKGSKKSKSKETDPVKQEEITAQPVVKKEETDPALKEAVAVKPVESAEIPAVKKDDPKPETKETELPPAEKEENKTAIKDTVVSKPVEDTVATEKNKESETQAKEQTVKTATEAKPVVTDSLKTSQVKKWAESSTTEGFGLVFIDDNENGQKDTIRLVIPNPKPVVIEVKEEPKEEKKFLDITAETPSKEETATGKGEKKTVIYKNKCGDEATETDFLKLRKRMAAEVSDDAMISEAKKYFKSTCFNVEQIKNLATLFLGDEGKYLFFEASYKHVTDLESFNSLQAELKDEYYAGRFKAMLRN